MSHLAIPSPTPSTLPEETRAAALSVEVMNDLDTGQPMLLASTEANQGDLQVVTPAQVLAKVNEQRAQLDRIEALANEYAARVVIPAFVEAYGIELVESDVPDGVQALADIEPAGSLHVVVPQGQTAIVRLAAIRDLIVHLQTKADAA